jgi:hypothetical protein
MFAQKPVVPRHEDCVPRFVVLGRTSVWQCSDAAAAASTSSLQRNAEQVIDCLCPGAKIVHVLLHSSGPHCGCSILTDLHELVAMRQCDVIVTDSIGRFGRNPYLQWTVIDGLVDRGARLISLEDDFDTAIDGWENARCFPAVSGRLKPTPDTAS